MVTKALINRLEALEKASPPVIETQGDKPISLGDFNKLMRPDFLYAKHMEVLDNALEDVAEYVLSKGKRGTSKLLVNMPRRHAKSTRVQKFSSWLQGLNPNTKIMLVCYGQSLANTSSRLIRNMIKSPQYKKIFPGVKLASDSASVQEWGIEGYDGGMHAVGVMGGATGKGGEVLIVDDIIKNRQDAESKTIREKVWNEFHDSFLSGLNAEYGAIICISTRWNNNDLVARLVDESPGEWKQLVFPALAIEEDELGRKPGDALWPERFSKVHLEKVRDTIAPYSWHSQYQQAPISSSGYLFQREWLNILDTKPVVRREVRYWDLAMSESKSADYTAGVKMAQCTDGTYAVTDVIRVRKDWADVPSFLHSVIVSDGVQCRQGIEKAGYMGSVLRTLQSNYNMAGHSIEGFPVTTSKFVRSLDIQAGYAHGKISIVKGDWNNAYIEELLSFTGEDGGAHDDQVDATAGAFSMLETTSSGGTVFVDNIRW